jgi:hypothetical protein
MRAHAGRARVGERREGDGAMQGDEGAAGDDALAAGAGEPHHAPVVLDRDVGGAEQEEAGLRRPLRLRDHAAEELPLRIVAAAAEAARTGHDVTAVDRLGLRDRRVGAGRKRAAVLPDLVLRSLREAGDQPLMRGEQAVDPAGRPAAARQRRLDLREHVEAVFEAAKSLRLEDAKQVRLAHLGDDVLADAPCGFRLERPLARRAGDGARPRQQLGDPGSIGAQRRVSSGSCPPGRAA